MGRAYARTIVSRPASARYERRVLRSKQRSSRVFDGVDGRGAAVTIVVRRDRPSLIGEARRLIGGSHPGIVGVRDADEGDDGWYIVNEAWSGPSLASLLTHTPIAGEDVVGLLVPIASALDHLANLGAVHEGLSAESVVVTRGRLALIGVPSGPAIAPTDREDSTMALRMPETLDYVPPELLARPPRPDVYAIGVLAFRLLSGEMPYPKYKSLTRTLVERRETPAQRVAAAARRPVPRAIESWADEALARDPRRRPLTASAVIESLARAVGKIADHEDAVSRLMELELSDAGASKATRLDSPIAAVLDVEASGPRLRETPFVGMDRVPSEEMAAIDVEIGRVSSIPPPPESASAPIVADASPRWPRLIAALLVMAAATFVTLALAHYLSS
jgi:serine/threonine protein kinase